MLVFIHTVRTPLFLVGLLLKLYTSFFFLFTHIIAFWLILTCQDTYSLRNQDGVIRGYIWYSHRVRVNLLCEGSKYCPLQGKDNVPLVFQRWQAFSTRAAHTNIVSEGSCVSLLDSNPVEFQSQQDFLRTSFPESKLSSSDTLPNAARFKSSITLKANQIFSQRCYWTKSGYINVCVFLKLFEEMMSAEHDIHSQI